MTIADIINGLKAVRTIHNGNYAPFIDGAIKELKAIEWIPVSERLPNLNDFSGPHVWEKKVLITGYLSFDDTKELFVSEVYASNIVHDCVPDTVVVAWMPLPTTYKPQESEEKE